MWMGGVKCKVAILLVITTVTIFTLYLYGAQLSFVTSPSHRHYIRKSLFTKDEEKQPGELSDYPTNHQEKIHVAKSFQFDIAGSDVLVFLHVQKTGGSHFGKRLVKDLDIARPCVCQKTKCCDCTCYRPNSRRIWLFSRYSVGWPCGVHADMTELRDCVPKYFAKFEGRRRQTQLRYLYVTNIREPISRFLSEFRHVQRGATWIEATHKCNGRIPTARELPRCYSGSKWDNVQLDAFVNCSWNLAINRQTRMLADLSLVNCYNKSGMSRATRDRIMLKSAKKNLERMAHFGLVEYQKESQYLFEQLIGLKFAASLRQRKMTYAKDTLLDLDQESVERIKRLNHLDVELYEFARALFAQRLMYFRGREDAEGGRKIDLLSP